MNAGDFPFSKRSRATSITRCACSVRTKVGSENAYISREPNQRAGDSVSFHAFGQFRVANQTLAELFAFAPSGNLIVLKDGQAEFTTGQYISGNFHRALGVSPVLGRTLLPEDDVVYTPYRQEPDGGAYLLVRSNLPLLTVSDAVRRTVRGIDPGQPLEPVQTLEQWMAIGLALGTAGALALTGVLSGLMVEIQPSDPATFAAVTILLTAVSIAACLLPARRATRVDPVVALRAE